MDKTVSIMELSNAYANLGLAQRHARLLVEALDCYDAGLLVAPESQHLLNYCQKVLVEKSQCTGSFGR
jgi:predicted ATP-grasp superfamily ATP-dependent carboligase